VRKTPLATRIGSAALTCVLWLPLNAGSQDAPAGNEELAPIVRACVDKNGQLESAEIARSSGYPEIDEAALKVARAAKFSPATKNGKPRRKSCVKFKVKFVIRDGEPVPAESSGQT
jgi:TonB family protein